MPEETLAEQFPQTPPIFIKEAMLDRFFKQRAIRESEITLAIDLSEGQPDDIKEAMLDTTFPQRFDKCVPSFGKPCPYRKLCFGDVSEPLSQGFQWRESHHDLEVATQAENEGV
jgi:hypothetical protein